MNIRGTFAMVLLSAVLAASLGLGSYAPTVAQDTAPSPTPTVPATPPVIDRYVSPPQTDQSAPGSVLSAAAVLGTYAVQANGTPVTTPFNLALGTAYTIRVSGVYVWGGCDPINCPDAGPEYIRWGDAGYLTDDRFRSTDTPFQGVAYLLYNDNIPDVGPYQSDHLYSFSVTGNGAPATFKIGDCEPCYGDNQGALRVEVIQGTDTSAFALGVLPLLQKSMVTTQSRWGGDPYGTIGYKLQPDDCGLTISACGCFLTSLAMMLDYRGSRDNFSNLRTNPRILNNWLRSHSGYSGLYVAADRVIMEYGFKEGKLLLKYMSSKPDNTQLHNLLAQGIPVDLLVKTSRYHHVLAVGETTAPDGSTTWYINDPYFPERITLKAYSNQYYYMQWADPQPTMLASLGLQLGSPAELLVTDPLGRRTGKDPVSGLTYDEIPGASYHEEATSDPSGIGGPGEPVKIF